MKAHGVVEVEGRFAVYNGTPFFFSGMGVGLNGTCTALGIRDGSGNEYKLYTDTPTNGATAAEVHALAQDAMLAALRHH